MLVVAFFRNRTLPHTTVFFPSLSVPNQYKLHKALFCKKNKQRKILTFKRIILYKKIIAFLKCVVSTLLKKKQNNSILERCISLLSRMVMKEIHQANDILLFLFYYHFLFLCVCSYIYMT